MRKGKDAWFEGRCRIVARKVGHVELADLWRTLAEATGATDTYGSIRRKVGNRGEEREFANPAELARFQREAGALRANEIYLSARNDMMKASIMRQQSAAILAPAPDDLIVNVMGPTDEAVAGVIAKVRRGAGGTISKGVAGRWLRVAGMLAIAFAGAFATAAGAAGAAQGLQWSVVGLGTVLIYVVASMIQHSLPAHWPGACQLLVEIGGEGRDFLKPECTRGRKEF